MSTFLRLLIAVLMLSVIAPGAHAKSKRPIKLVEGTTAAQQVVAQIASHALRKSGFKSELVSVPDAETVAALVSGGAHAHLTLPNGSDDALSEALDARSVVSLGGLQGNKRDEPVLKVVASSMKSRWPYAQKMLKRLVLPPDTVEMLAAEVDAGASPENVAADWMKSHPKTWKPWIAASKNWMKP